MTAPFPPCPVCHTADWVAPVFEDHETGDVWQYDCLNHEPWVRFAESGAEVFVQAALEVA